MWRGGGGGRNPTKANTVDSKKTKNHNPPFPGWAGQLDRRLIQSLPPGSPESARIHRFLLSNHLDGWWRLRVAVRFARWWNDPAVRRRPVRRPVKLRHMERMLGGLIPFAGTDDPTLEGLIMLAVVRVAPDASSAFDLGEELAIAAAFERSGWTPHAGCCVNAWEYPAFTAAEMRAFGEARGPDLFALLAAI